MLTIVNGVDLLGFGHCEVLKTIDDAPRRVIIRLLKPRLYNIRVINQDTMECQVERNHFLKEVKLFCDLKDCAPTFREYERKIFVERGDQFLRMNEEDTTNIQAKDEYCDDLVLRYGGNNLDPEGAWSVTELAE